METWLTAGKLRRDVPGSYIEANLRYIAVFSSTLDSNGWDASESKEVWHKLISFIGLLNPIYVYLYVTKFGVRFVCFNTCEAEKNIWSLMAITN